MKSRIWLGSVLALGVLGCAPNPAGTASNPYGIPRSVSVGLPDSLKSVSALKSVNAYRTQASSFSIAEQINGNLTVYTESTKLVDAILSAVSGANLPPGKPFTFTGEDGKEMTVLLELKSDRAVISIGEGKSATGETQVMAISYTSPKKGRAVFKPRQNVPGLGRFVLETTFDLDAGKASANGYADTTVLQGVQDPHKMCVHWEFENIKEPPAGKPWFTMKASAFVSKPNNASQSGVFALTANCLKDGSDAAIVGVQSPFVNGNTFTLVPSNNSNPSDTSFFLSASGKDLTSTQASASLKAVLPTREMIYEPFPADPSTMDALTLSVFQFPQ